MILKIFPYLSLFYLLLTSQLCIAQNIYCIRNTTDTTGNILFEFASIDVTTGTISTLSQLPFIHYSPEFSSAYDYNNDYYYYCGSYAMHTINISNGAIVKIDSLHLPAYERLFHIAFNPWDNSIYGVINNLLTFDKWLGRYSPITGDLVKLYPLDANIEIPIGTQSFLDPLLQKYYLVSQKYTAINLLDSTINVNVDFQNNTNHYFSNSDFNCNQTYPIGLNNDIVSKQVFISNLDTAGNTIINVSNIPLPLVYFRHHFGGSTMDILSNKLYYSDYNGLLYEIDINSGAVTSIASAGPYSKFLFIEYSNVNSCTIYDVNDRHSEKFLISVFPNPSNGILGFKFEEGLIVSGELSIFNYLGQCVYKSTISDSIFSADITDCVSGIYQYGIHINKKQYSGLISLR